jgi:ribosome-binding protein aMBF1 (putative translation factor)
VNVTKSSAAGREATRVRHKLSPPGRGSRAAAGVDEDALLKVFARNVRLIRKLRALSQEALADQADLDRTYISSIERAKRNVSIRNIQRLAIALQVDPRDLLSPDAEATQASA